jgi:hypothetical protein
MNLDPRSPFNWRLDPRPSIFATDPSFRAGKNGKSISETQTEHMNKRRDEGEAVGYVYGLGKESKEKVDRMLAYKQFGVYSRAQPVKKANKHEGKE